MIDVIEKYIESFADSGSDAPRRRACQKWCIIEKGSRQTLRWIPFSRMRLFSLVI